MTIDEITKAMRSDLKKAGFNARRVSVRKQDAGYSWAVRVTVKDPTASLREVERIAKRYEEFERDAASYEILEGGNVYVLVDYESGIFDELSKPYEEEARKLIGKLEGHELVQARENLWLWDDRGRLVMREGGRGQRLMGGPRDIAEYLCKFDLHHDIAA